MNMSGSRGLARGIRWLLSFVVLMGTVPYCFTTEASAADTYGYHAVPVSGTWDIDSSGMFETPYGVAADGSGNVYVADTFNDRIQKFDAGGTFVTAWGSEGSGNGEFAEPQGVAADAGGNVYVADTHNHRVQKFDASGRFVTAWGSQGDGNGQFSFPGGIAVDGGGNVYVADTFNHRIQKFDSSGAFLAVLGSYGTENGQFSGPMGVAVDGGGNVYVADRNNQRIQKLDANGAFATAWGNYGSGYGEFSGPSGVAVDGNGNVYVADWGNSRIQKFDANGTFVTAWGINGNGSGELSYPIGVAADGSGNVYVTDTDNHRIQKFDANGAMQGTWGAYSVRTMQVATVATDRLGYVYAVDARNARIQKFDPNGTFVTAMGGRGSGQGEMNSPLGAAIDGSGNVYAVDYGNRRIQKFDANGAFIATLGSYGSGDGQFTEPAGIAVDGSGNVYVSDLGNSRIQKFDASGAFLTAWGSRGSGQAEMDGPAGIAADGSGNVYVADTNNHRIQKFDASGEFAAAWGSYGSGNGQLAGPAGVAVDGSGNVYVADRDNRRIQKFDSNGGFLSQWAAEYPFSVAVGPSGDVFVNRGSQVGKYMADNIADAVGLTLSAGALSPSFDPDTERYAASVAANVKSVAVTPTPADPLAAVSVSDRSGTVAGVVYGGATSYPVNLHVGDNPVTVAIASYDGSATKTYTIVVNRAASAIGELSATAGDRVVDLAWTRVAEAVYYNVNRGTTDGGPYEPIATNLMTAAYADTGLTNGKTYYYVVTAVDETGEIGRSNQAETKPASRNSGDSGGSSGSDGSGSHPMPPADPVPGGDGVLQLTVTPQQGGTGELKGVVKLKVPAGAVPAGGRITAAVVGHDQAPPTSGLESVSPVVELTSSTGRTFGKPVEITFHYDREKVGPPHTAAAYYFNERQRRWIYIGGTVNADGTVTVSVNHFTRFAVFKYHPLSLADLTGHWAKAYTDRLVGMKAIQGYPDGTFRPEATVTRAQFVRMLAEALGLPAAPNLTDFADGGEIPSWTRSAVAAAVKAGLTSGYPERDGVRFKPDQTITRAEMAVMIARALGADKNAAEGGADYFKDRAAMPDWARAPIQTAVSAGILKGYEDGTFRSDRHATRAEAAAMIYKLLEVLNL